MGRRKLSLNLISNRKSRILTFKKRKNSLMKKAYELSTLCDVRTCVLIHGPAEDPSQSNLQFHTWPSNRTDLEAMIRAYKANSSCNFQKHKCFSLTDFFSDRKRKIETEMCKLREKVEEVTCPKWDERLDRLSEHELREFMEGLDAKIEAANGMIDFMEVDYEDLFGALCPENTVQMGVDSNPPPVLNPSVDKLDLLDLFTIPSANETDSPDLFTIPSTNELDLPDLFTTGANPNDEDVAMDEFNIKHLQMLLGEEEEDNYVAHYANLMNDEFDYCNNIEHLMMSAANF